MKRWLKYLGDKTYLHIYFNISGFNKTITRFKNMTCNYCGSLSETDLRNLYLALKLKREKMFDETSLVLSISMYREKTQMIKL